MSNTQKLTYMHKLPRFRSPSWARLVSNLVSPPITWAVWAFATAWTYSANPSEALLWTILYTTFVSWLPVIFVAYQVKSGRIGNIHMDESHERILPFIVSVSLTAFIGIILALMVAPAQLWLIALMSAVQVCTLGVITIVWHISMHTMSMMGTTMATYLMFGFEVAMALLPLILLVTSARLKLQRHTPAQLVWGVIVGGMIPVILLLPMPLLYDWLGTW